MHHDALSRLRAQLDRHPGVVTRAPGRANLIGEHTDYNGGFVLPVALEMATYVAGDRRDGPITLRSLEEPGRVVVDPRTGEGTESGWGRYVTAVVRSLLDAGVPPAGLDGVVSSDVPLGAGLASSSALEVAVALALSGERLDVLTLARICRRAENEYVGVPSGLMDPLACTAAEVAHALLIDCEAETYEHVPLPDGLVVLLIDSGVARNLDDVGYAERVEQCNEAAKILGVGSLRHADPDILRERDSDLDPLILRRARHVVSENERVTRAAAALRDGNLPEVGELFAASHQSLAQDFEVSTPELDLLVSLASEMQGVVGARLTGAGFGGCTVNLVEAAAAERTAEHICDRYRAATGRPTRWWISKPAEGASLSLA